MFDRSGNEVKSSQPSDRDQLIRMLVEMKVARINHRSQLQRSWLTFSGDLECAT